jgi:HK97 family phage major capsid protein
MAKNDETVTVPKADFEKALEKAKQYDAVANTPIFKSQQFDASGRLRGEFVEEDEGEVITMVSGRDDLVSTPKAERWNSKRKSMMKQIIGAGYQPKAVFKSLNQFVREGLDGHKTTGFQEKHRTAFKAIQGMSEAIGSDGGFTVLPEFTTKIFSRIYSNDLLAQTDGYTVGGNNMTFLANAETSRVDGSRHGGLRGYWTGEGNTITASKPTVRELQIKLQKVAVVVYLTDELINDSAQALEKYVTEKAADEFNFLIGAALFRGDGVFKPLGVLNAPSLLAITPEVGQAAKTIVTENITKMHGRFFQPFLQNARFYLNQDVLQSLNVMTLGIGAAGVSTYLPSTGLSGNRYGDLMGVPKQPIEFASTLGTQGDIVLADLGQMLSITKGGIQQAVSMHVEFLTDQLALRFTMRVNAAPWENAPTTPYQGTNTQSSFVALSAR